MNRVREVGTIFSNLRIGLETLISLLGLWQVTNRASIQTATVLKLIRDLEKINEWYL